MNRTISAISTPERLRDRYGVGTRGRSDAAARQVLGLAGLRRSSIFSDDRRPMSAQVHLRNASIRLRSHITNFSIRSMSSHHLRAAACTGSSRSAAIFSLSDKPQSILTSSGRDSRPSPRACASPPDGSGSSSNFPAQDLRLGKVLRSSWQRESGCRQREIIQVAGFALRLFDRLAPWPPIRVCSAWRYRALPQDSFLPFRRPLVRGSRGSDG